MSKTAFTRNWVHDFQYCQSAIILNFLNVTVCSINDKKGEELHMYIFECPQDEPLSELNK